MEIIIKYVFRFRLKLWTKNRYLVWRYYVWIIFPYYKKINGARGNRTLGVWFGIRHVTITPWPLFSCQNIFDISHTNIVFWINWLRYEYDIFNLMFFGRIRWNWNPLWPFTLSSKPCRHRFNGRNTLNIFKKNPKTILYVHL